MMDDLVPDDLRDFILKHIDSVAQLEALLLLRANSAESWDTPGTAKRLYVGEDETAEILTRLCAHGLLTCQEGLYRYAPGGDDQRVMVDRLADVYARHLIPVTNIVHSKPRRIREFADAFRFRKDR